MDPAPQKQRTAWTIFLLASALVIGLSGPGRGEDPQPPAADLPALSTALADLAEKVAGATVTLQLRRSGDDGQMVAGEGSGFVVDAFAGIVVTNAHVVGEAETVRVVFHDQREVIGKVSGSDPQSDVAVVRIDPGAARQQLSWGDSDALRPGHLVMAIGSPLQLEGTTSLGVISALHRRLHTAPDDPFYEDFLQFDAFIDRGSSGGPLVDMRGEVVGINTAIASNAQSQAWRGIGYAVPSALARRYAEDLARLGKVRRGWLGVSVSAVTPDLARTLGLDRPYGAVLRTVSADGPAAAAGLKPNEVLLSIDGVEIESAAHVRARVAALEPGKTAVLQVFAQGRMRRVELKIGEFAEQEDV